MYSMLKRCPELLAWTKLGKRIALDVALGLNYLHSRWVSHLHPSGLVPTAAVACWDDNMANAAGVCSLRESWAVLASGWRALGCSCVGGSSSLRVAPLVSCWMSTPGV